VDEVQELHQGEQPAKGRQPLGALAVGRLRCDPQGRLGPVAPCTPPRFAVRFRVTIGFPPVGLVVLEGQPILWRFPMVFQWVFARSAQKPGNNCPPVVDDCRLTLLLSLRVLSALMTLLLTACFRRCPSPPTYPPGGPQKPKHAPFVGYCEVVSRSCRNVLRWCATWIHTALNCDDEEAAASLQVSQGTRRVPHLSIRRVLVSWQLPPAWVTARVRYGWHGEC